MCVDDSLSDDSVCWTVVGDALAAVVEFEGDAECVRKWTVNLSKCTAGTSFVWFALVRIGILDLRCV